MANIGNGHGMFKRINHYWRILGTGISFVVFGIGGILFRIIVFPLLNILIWNQQLRIIYARRIIRFAFRVFADLMSFLGVLRYNIHGLERLERKGLLILANHPTLIDTVFLMAFVKQADCIIKSALWHNPFTRGSVRAAGYICNDDGPGLIEDCSASLNNGNNLIIFPEGTRTARDGIMEFKRGAANIAVRGKHNVTPIVIRSVPLTLVRGEKWWQVPPTKPVITIEVQEDIEVQTFLTRAGSEILAARQLTEYLQDYFMKENNNAKT